MREKRSAMKGEEMMSMVMIYMQKRESFILCLPISRPFVFTLIWVHPRVAELCFYAFANGGEAGRLLIEIGLAERRCDQTVYSEPRVSSTHSI